MAMAAMNMVSASGVFWGKLSFKEMFAGGCLCTSQENPHIWFPTIKVGPPDGTSETSNVPAGTIMKCMSSVN